MRFVLLYIVLNLFTVSVFGDEITVKNLESRTKTVVESLIQLSPDKETELKKALEEVASIRRDYYKIGSPVEHNSNSRKIIAYIDLLSDEILNDTTSVAMFGNTYEEVTTNLLEEMTTQKKEIEESTEKGSLTLELLFAAVGSRFINFKKLGKGATADLEKQKIHYEVSVLLSDLKYFPAELYAPEEDLHDYRKMIVEWLTKNDPIVKHNNVNVQLKEIKSNAPELKKIEEQKKITRRLESMTGEAVERHKVEYFGGLGNHLDDCGRKLTNGSQIPVPNELKPNEEGLYNSTAGSQTRKHFIENKNTWYNSRADWKGVLKNGASTVGRKG